MWTGAGGVGGESEGLAWQHPMGGSGQEGRRGQGCRIQRKLFPVYFLGSRYVSHRNSPGTLGGGGRTSLSEHVTKA